MGLATPWRGLARPSPGLFQRKGSRNNANKDDDGTASTDDNTSSEGGDGADPGRTIRLSIRDRDGRPPRAATPAPGDGNNDNNNNKARGGQPKRRAATARTAPVRPKARRSDNRPPPRQRSRSRPSDRLVGRDGRGGGGGGGDYNRKGGGRDRRRSRSSQSRRRGAESRRDVRRGRSASARPREAGRSSGRGLSRGLSREVGRRPEESRERPGRPDAERAGPDEKEARRRAASSSARHRERGAREREERGRRSQRQQQGQPSRDHRRPTVNRDAARDQAHPPRDEGDSDPTRRARSANPARREERRAEQPTRNDDRREDDRRGPRRSDRRGARQGRPQPGRSGRAAAPSRRRGRSCAAPSERARDGENDREDPAEAYRQLYHENRHLRRSEPFLGLPRSDGREYARHQPRRRGGRSRSADPLLLTDDGGREGRREDRWAASSPRRRHRSRPRVLRLTDGREDRWGRTAEQRDGDRGKTWAQRRRERRSRSRPRLGGGGPSRRGPSSRTRSRTGRDRDASPTASLTSALSAVGMERRRSERSRSRNGPADGRRRGADGRPGQQQQREERAGPPGGQEVHRGDGRLGRLGRRLSSMSPLRRLRSASPPGRLPSSSPDRRAARRPTAGRVRRTVPLERVSEDGSAREESLPGDDRGQDDGRAPADGPAGPSRFPRNRSDNSFVNSCFGTVESSLDASRRRAPGRGADDGAGGRDGGDDDTPPPAASPAGGDGAGGGRGDEIEDGSDGSVGRRGTADGEDAAPSCRDQRRDSGDSGAEADPQGGSDGSASSDPTRPSDSIPSHRSDSMGEDDLAAAESARRGRSSREDMVPASATQMRRPSEAPSLFRRRSSEMPSSALVRAPSLLDGSRASGSGGSVAGSSRGSARLPIQRRHSAGVSSLLDGSAPSLFGESRAGGGLDRSGSTKRGGSGSTQKSSWRGRSSVAPSLFGESCATVGPESFAAGHAGPVISPPSTDDDDTAGPSYAGYADEDDGSAVDIREVHNVLAQLTLLRCDSDGTTVDQDGDVEEIFSCDGSSLGMTATARSLADAGHGTGRASGSGWDDASRRSSQTCAPAFGRGDDCGGCPATAAASRKLPSLPLPPPRRSGPTPAVRPSAPPTAANSARRGSPPAPAHPSAPSRRHLLAGCDWSSSGSSVTDGGGGGADMCPKTPRPRPAVPPMTSATARMINARSVENLIVSTRLAGPGLYTGGIDGFGRPTGRGFAHFDSGRYFEGEWINGLPNACEYLAQNPPATRLPIPTSGPHAPRRPAAGTAGGATPLHSDHPRANPGGGLQIQMIPPPFCPRSGGMRQRQLPQQ